MPPPTSATSLPTSPIPLEAKERPTRASAAYAITIVRGATSNPHGVTGHDEAGHVCDQLTAGSRHRRAVPAARSYHHDLGHEGIDAVESVR